MQQSKDLPDAILLELAYLPPIQYFSKFLLHGEVWIEMQENYQKGSYRNRCHIAGPNGMLRLSIPLRGGKHQQQAIRKVRIQSGEGWQRRHWQSIQTAYGNAPFFEFYADAISVFFERRYAFLFDLNRDLLLTCLGLLGLDPSLRWTSRYEATPEGNILDFRGVISPKKPAGSTDPFFLSPRYPQIFEEKNGFFPNLSILDLLFCCGPQASMLLASSLVKP